MYFINDNVFNVSRTFVYHTVYAANSNFQVEHGVVSFRIYLDLALRIKTTDNFSLHCEFRLGVGFFQIYLDMVLRFQIRERSRGIA